MREEEAGVAGPGSDDTGRQEGLLLDGGGRGGLEGVSILQGPPYWEGVAPEGEGLGVGERRRLLPVRAANSSLTWRRTTLLTSGIRAGGSTGPGGRAAQGVPLARVGAGWACLVVRLGAGRFGGETGRVPAGPVGVAGGAGVGRGPLPLPLPFVLVTPLAALARVTVRLLAEVEEG